MRWKYFSDRRFWPEADDVPFFIRFMPVPENRFMGGLSLNIEKAFHVLVKMVMGMKAFWKESVQTRARKTRCVIPSISRCFF